MCFVSVCESVEVHLCGIWNSRKKKLYSSGSSDLVLHRSIKQIHVVYGRNAMAMHSRDIFNSIL